jgi:hypothetical protein
MSRGQLMDAVVKPRIRTPSPSIIRDEDESRHFDFFRSQTIRTSNSSLDHRVWGDLVMKLAHSEPAIKHCVIALSLLHQRCQQKDALRTENMQDILMQHQKALTNARVLLETGHESDVSKVLLVCMLFVCYANHTGQYAVGQTHLSSGLKILHQYRQKSTPDLTLMYSTQNANVDALAEVFSRLDFQAMTFSDDRAPYQYSSYPLWSPDHMSTPIAFQDFCHLNDASISLMEIARNFMYFSDSLEKGETPRTEFIRKQAQYSQMLVHWEDKFSALKCSYLDSQAQPQLSLLVMYHLTLKVIAGCAHDGFESSWDIFVPSFATIIKNAYAFVQMDDALISKANDTVFSFNIGITIPLFITAIKCRDPGVRREAIRLLRHRRRLEGVWDSIGAAAVAEKVMLLEERTVVSVGIATDVPEEARIHNTMIMVNREEKRAYATLLYRSATSINGWEQTKCVINF